MKSADFGFRLLLSLLLPLAAMGAVAQNTGTPAMPPVQAPPALDDPGVKLATPDAVAKTAADKAKATKPEPKAADTRGMPPDVQASADATELPVVTVRQQGSDTIEEYRKHGKLYFVRVLSKTGPPKYYVDNRTDVPPTMRQVSGPSGVVQPVYFKLFQWK